MENNFEKRNNSLKTLPGGLKIKKACGPHSCSNKALVLISRDSVKRESKSESYSEHQVAEETVFLDNKSLPGSYIEEQEDLRNVIPLDCKSLANAMVAFFDKYFISADNVQCSEATLGKFKSNLKIALGLSNPECSNTCSWHSLLRVFVTSLREGKDVIREMTNYGASCGPHGHLVDINYYKSLYKAYKNLPLTPKRANEILAEYTPKLIMPRVQLKRLIKIKSLGSGTEGRVYKCLQIPEDLSLTPDFKPCFFAVKVVHIPSDTFFLNFADTSGQFVQMMGSAIASCTSDDWVSSFRKIILTKSQYGELQNMLTNQLQGRDENQPSCVSESAAKADSVSESRSNSTNCPMFSGEQIERGEQPNDNNKHITVTAREDGKNAENNNVLVKKRERFFGYSALNNINLIYNRYIRNNKIYMIFQYMHYGALSELLAFESKYVKFMTARSQEQENYIEENREAVSSSTKDGQQQSVSERLKHRCHFPERAAAFIMSQILCALVVLHDRVLLVDLYNPLKPITVENGKKGKTKECTGSELATEENASAMMDSEDSLIFKVSTVHRDLKPSNIMLSPNQTHNGSSPAANFYYDTIHPSPFPVFIRLADFGAATVTCGIGANTFKGTPSYMSPERLLLQKHDYKSDIWSAGVIAAEILLGAYPYCQKKAPETALRPCPTSGLSGSFLVEDPKEGKSDSLKSTLRREYENCSKACANEDVKSSLHCGTSMCHLVQEIVIEKKQIILPQVPKEAFSDGQDVRDLYNEYYSADAQDFLNHALEYSPKHRWSARQLLNHPWINNEKTYTQGIDELREMLDVYYKRYYFYKNGSGSHKPCAYYIKEWMQNPEKNEFDLSMA